MRTRVEILCIAMTAIFCKYSMDIVGIQFEDGSNRKFNVQFFGDCSWVFIELTEEEMKQAELELDTAQ